uniref:Uncharacterized protein n=1 Tax=Arundo donax TaxID=35708 RepID=A0A0A8YZR5_ARUDO
MTMRRPFISSRHNSYPLTIMLSTISPVSSRSGTLSLVFLPVSASKSY